MIDMHSRSNEVIQCNYYYEQYITSNVVEYSCSQYIACIVICIYYMYMYILCILYVYIIVILICIITF